MPVKNEAEELMKKMLLEAVKELADQRLPKGVPRPVIDIALKEVEKELEDIHIFK